MTGVPEGPSSRILIEFFQDDLRESYFVCSGGFYLGNQVTVDRGILREISSYSSYVTLGESSCILGGCLDLDFQAIDDVSTWGSSSDSIGKVELFLKINKILTESQ